MLRSLINGALRSGAMSGRRGVGAGSAYGGRGYGGRGYTSGAGRNDIGGQIGAQVGRALMNRLARRR